MSKKVWWIVIIIVAVIVVGYAAKHHGSPKEAAGSTVKIGLLSPFTGDAAVYGEPVRNVVLMAAEEINGQGGIDGKQIEIIAEDGKCTGTDAANATQKLINVDKVQIVIGGFCSSESLAAVPIAEQAEVVLVSPGSSSPKLTGISEYFFRNYPSDSTQGKVLAGAAFNTKKWDSVAFIQEQTDYAVGVFEAFDAEFKSLGGTTVNQAFPTNATDFRSILTTLRAQNPDALFIDVQTPQAADRILKQLKELGWKPSLLVNDAVAGDPATVKANAAQLEGALTAEFGVDEANAKFKHLLEAYAEKYGAEAPYQSYMQTVYDSVYLLKEGIEEVGYDGKALASWSRTIKDWAGASGAITIQPNGDRASGHRLEVITNGAPKPQGS